MLLHWDDRKYHTLDVILTVVLLAGVVAFVVAWYFELLPPRWLPLTVLPVALSQWYKYRLQKLFKTYGGAYVTVENNRLVLSKPDQDFEKAIKFREIQTVSPGRWLLLEKLTLSLKDGHKVDLINFHEQSAILDRIKS